MESLDVFTRAYIECALWSSTDGDNPLDADHDASDIAPETLAAMVKDCTAFQSAHFDLISNDLNRAGHDFWLTRNGHGAGFWDGDWPEPDATTLTDAAHKFGAVDLYVGDDGKIYA